MIESTNTQLSKKYLIKPISKDQHGMVATIRNIRKSKEEIERRKKNASRQLS